MVGVARVTSAVLVGREQQLASLNVCLQRVGGGEALVAVLLGEAGVGKTRCVSAFLERAGRGGAATLLGGCVPVSGGEVAYAPIAQALRRCDAEHPVPPELPGRLLTDLAGYLRSLDAPVVLAVEDVHWSDASTRDLVAALVRAREVPRLLVVLTCRGEEVAAASPVRAWLAELGRAAPTERITVPPLSREHTEVLLGYILGAPPRRDLAAGIYARCGGNPLYAEELLATPGQTVPASIRDAVLARFAALPDDAQRLVNAAAVATASGATVAHDLLAAILGADPGDPDGVVIAAAQDAVAAHLLRADPDGGYTFRHPLTREAVEADLLPVHRRRLHAAVARALDPVASPDRSARSRGVDAQTAARVAFHWHAAADPGRALAATVAAGAAARAVFGFHEAAAAYERAIELWPAVPDAATISGVDLVELYAHASDAHQYARHNERAVELARTALRRVDSATDPDRAARLHHLVGQAEWAATGDSAAALVEYQAALRLLTAPTAARARALTDTATCLMTLDRFAESRSMAEQAVTLARQVADPAAEANATVTLGFDLAYLGEPERADRLVVEGRRLGERVGDVLSVGRSWVNRALLHERLGRLTDMVDEARAGIAAATRFGLARSTALVLGLIAGFGLVRLGRFAEAAEHTSPAVADGDGNVRTWALHAQATLDLVHGRLDAATDHIEQALRLVDGRCNPRAVEPVYAVAAELALMTGRPAAAAAVVAEGLRSIDRAGGAGRPARLCWLGVRAAADGADVNPASWRERALAHPASAFDEPLYAAMLRGEWSRWQAHHEGTRPDPEPFDVAADGFDAHGAVYLAGYPRWRAAEAYLARGDRTAATTRLRAAHALGERLSATALHQQCAGLARRARIRIAADTAAPPAAAPPAGLTAREADVLTLLSEGRTNRQIARQLFISEHTVGVHVSRILTKLGVARRTEAAAAAHRLGLHQR
jgi:DNA-binding CsgD family transcriptional regulator